MEKAPGNDKRVGDILGIQDVKRDSPSKKKSQELLRRYVEAKETVSRMQADLLQRMRTDPDFWDNPYKRVFDDPGFFDDEEKTAIINILEHCTELHAAVENAYERFPDHADLYHYVFARSPKGRVEVIKGPVSLYFRCFDIEDYAWIHSQSFVNQQSKALTQEDINLADQSGGCSISTAIHPELAGAIIAEKSLEKNTDPESVQKHEEEHVIRRIIKDEWWPERPPEDVRYDPELRRNIENLINSSGGKLPEKFLDHLSKETAESHISYIIRALSGDIYAKGADEILAYFKDGEHTASGTFYLLTRLAKQGGLYDYYQLECDNVKELLTSNESTKEMIEGIFGKAREKYHLVLLAAIKTLLRIYKTGRYSRDEIIALFDKEPLLKWPKVAERIA